MLGRGEVLADDYVIDALLGKGGMGKAVRSDGYGYLCVRV